MIQAGENIKTMTVQGMVWISCGGWTRTSDLQVMRGNLRPLTADLQATRF